MKKWVKAVLSAAMVATFALGALAFASCGVSEKTDPASLKSQKVTAETWSQAVTDTSTSVNEGTNYSISVFMEYTAVKNEVTNNSSMTAVIKVSETAIYAKMETDEKTSTSSVASMRIETTMSAEDYKKEGLSGQLEMLTYIYSGLLSKVSAYADFEYSDEDKGYVASKEVGDEPAAKVVVKFVDNKLAYVGTEMSSERMSAKAGVMFFDIGTTKISLPKV